jgi:hypothetical protein
VVHPNQKHWESFLKDSEHSVAIDDSSFEPCSYRLGANGYDSWGEFA